MSWGPRKRISSMAVAVHPPPAAPWIRRALTVSRTALRTCRAIVSLASFMSSLAGVHPLGGSGIALEDGLLCADKLVQLCKPPAGSAAAAPMNLKRRIGIDVSDLEQGRLRFADDDFWLQFWWFTPRPKVEIYSSSAIGLPTASSPI